MHTFISQHSGVTLSLCEFEVSLVYRAISKTGSKATYIEKPCFKGKKEKKKKYQN